MGREIQTAHANAPADWVHHGRACNAGHDKLIQCGTAWQRLRIQHNCAWHVQPVGPPDGFSALEVTSVQTA